MNNNYKQFLIWWDDFSTNYKVLVATTVNIDLATLTTGREVTPEELLSTDRQASWSAWLASRMCASWSAWVWQDGILAKLECNLDSKKRVSKLDPVMQ